LEVKRELERKSDGLTDWTQQRSGLYVDADAGQLAIVREIVNKYPNLSVVEASHSPGRQTFDSLRCTTSRWPMSLEANCDVPPFSLAEHRKIGVFPQFSTIDGIRTQSNRLRMR
jgi:hypothetical protein